MISFRMRRSPVSGREVYADPSIVLAFALTICVRAAADEASRATRPIPFRHIVIDRDQPDHPHCKAVGDVSGDGRVDVLAASAFGAGLFWYEYPNWSKYRIDSGAFTTDMQTGDVDGDRDLDVVIPRDGTGLVWYENPRPRGDPRKDAWSRHQIDREGAHDLEVGDIDGDGRLDVAARYGETRVFLQEKPKTWRKIRIPTGGRGGTALGDLDGDGDLDIAENGYWLETPEDRGSTWTRHEIAGGWPDDTGVHIADLNGDGHPDVLLAPAETSGRLAWYESRSPRRGPWSEHLIDSDVSHIHTFKTADVNDDGRLDVVTAEMEQSPERRISVYFNLGEASTWRQQVVGRSGSHNLRVADIGGDGDIDIVGANHGNHGGPTPLDLWENLLRDSTPALPLDRWRRHVVDDSRPWRAVFIASADLDGDDAGDIVTGGWWYRNPGSPGVRWMRREIGEPLRNMAAVHDFDRDGDFDVLGTTGEGSSASAQFVWARNDGEGRFTILDNIARADGDFLQGVAVASFPGYRRLGVALSWHQGGHGIQMLTLPPDPSGGTWTWQRISDISQDEALSAGHIDGRLDLDLLLGTKWLRDSRNSWSVRSVADVPGSPDRNRLADMNGDGRLDAVVGFEAINKPGKLAWYEQPGSLEDAWPEHIIAQVVGPMSLDVADLDRDGDPDVVVGEHNYAEPATAKLMVFENLDARGDQWKRHVVHTGDEHHDGAILVDIDRDGDLDIISIGWSHDDVLLYENKAID